MPLHIATMLRRSANMRVVSFVVLVLAASMSLTPTALYAQSARSYAYTNITTDITVRTDTTFDVRETQTYTFTGTYHKGWRAIPYKKIDAITDVRVYDGASGTALAYSPTPLDKNDPSSWGKYTFYDENGALDIEWYFNKTDTVHAWTLAYTVHGGLSFYADHDELYWNILTDYSVPVGTANVLITLPASAPADDLAVADYLTGGARHDARVTSSRTAVAHADALAPYAKYTVAFAWPKGIVDERAYWNDFAHTYAPVLVGAALLLLSLLFAIVYWYFTERYPTGRGTVVAEYEPPNRLPPAMAEVITKEHISKRTWSATVVDLAVRGYLTVTEKPASFSATFLRATFRVLPLIFVIIMFVLVATAAHAAAVVWLAVTSGLFLVMLITRARNATRDYVLALERPEYAKNEGDLRGYEVAFLDALFDHGSTPELDTAALRKSQAGRQRMYKALQIAEKALREEVQTLGIYARPLTREVSLRGVAIAAWFIIVWITLLAKVDGRTTFLIASASFATILTAYMLFGEARLNPTGNKLKDDWLGFKLYLKTAERYRLENLTPQTFERYLPYAMVFDVERQWGRAFASISQAPPGWYHGTTAASGGWTHDGGFSATTFSHSLSASLTSSLAASGAGGSGASGGGGSAGGGGGGGGGGAS